MKAALGVLKGAQADFLDGGLLDVRRVVEADVFSDFLEQAEHLLESGYHGPAAVVVGCVLEDGLRKLCGQHGIALPDKPKLDRMNAELAKKSAYDGLAQKEVTAKSHIRNDAAHGRWNRFVADDVKAMLSFVRRFLVDHLS